MREVQASDAKTHLPRLLDEVERGETVIITRHGKPIARLVPDEDRRQADAKRAIEELDELRRELPRATLAEIREWIGEGRR